MENIKNALASVPASHKDARMTLESALAVPSLGADLALTSAYATALSLGATKLAALLGEQLDEAHKEQGGVAAAIMGMTNVYYSFIDTADVPGVRQLPAQIRMVSYGVQANRDKLGFEAAALAVSMAGKCKPCIVSHVDELKKLGFTDEQFRDLARIAAGVNSVAKVFG
jgi:lipoyl-dependent peroxiredoxin subunit D